MANRSTVGTLKRRWTAYQFVHSLSPFAALTYVVGMLLAVLAIYPLSRVFVRLFWVDGEFNLRAIERVAEMSDLGGLVWNTLVLVVVSSALALAIGAGMAWLNERTDARMGLVTDMLPLIPFLLPPVAGAIGWALLLSPRGGLANGWIRDLLGWVGIELTEGPLDIHSWYGLVLVFVVYQVPYVFLLVSAGLRGMDPSLEAQARVNGAGKLRMLRRITIPALGPSLAGAVLLMAWQGFALYSVPAIIGTPAGIDVLSVRIVNLLSFTFPPDTDVAVALSAIVLLFVGTIWYVQTRVLKRARHATVSGKGHQVRRLGLGVWKWPARLFILGYIIVAAVLPVVALLLVSLNGFWTPDIDWGSLSFDGLREAVFEDQVTRRALQNSLLLSVGGALTAMLGAAFISTLVVGSSRRWHRTLDGAIKLPAIISNVVIAVGFLLAFSGPPFNLGATLLILYLAYIVLYLPQGSVAADAAAGQVGTELTGSARVCGAGGGRVFRRIRLPLMLPGLVAGWALLFSRMAGDLTASAVLSSSGNQVVGMRILTIYDGGSYALLASLTLILVLMTGTVVTVALKLTRRRAQAAGLI